ncbi:thiamine pyrophosphate-binding protein [Salinirarus marinus]|uniref:thiamine pyrophosphate-binding protein n=1 Tax=Salinirarus marinus TaxID=3068310 RepID=UPI003C6C4093
MHVNEALVDRLVERGVETMFGIPGKQSLPLNETIGNRDDIEFVVARHETAVSHEAWGYAETSGRMAATCVVPGPGDMNAMNGLKNALNDCTPLLHVAIETEPELRGGDAIHETPPDTYDNVVKENVLVETPESALAELDRAIAVARTPPKGPVRFGIPKNFLKMETSLAEAGEFVTDSVRGVPAEGVDSAADALADAESPVVVAGGGVRTADATDRLLAVAERLDAPVVTTYKGKGVVPEDHPLSAGVLCGGASSDLLDLLATADAALGVGTDLDALTTRAFTVDLPETLVTVTLHASDVGQGYEPAVSLVCDARDALDAIDGALSERGRDRNVETAANRASAVRRAAAERMAELRADDEPPLTSPGALQAVREALPREAIVSADAGGSRIWTLVSFPAYGPRQYVNPGSWATMGTGLPGAIGASMANPDADVVALSGDGGLMMCVHELHTAVSEGIPVTVVVLNNSDYAIISEEASRSYDLDEMAYGWDETPIDCCAVAAGMGMETLRAETPAEIRDALGTALDSDEPTLVEIPTDPTEPQASVWMD